MKKKRCQIYAGLPITCFEVPIIGETELNLTADEIYKCLCAKAEVIEILPDGKRINLDFTNYGKNNHITESIEEPVEVPVEEKTPEPTPAPVEEPEVVEETTIEEKTEEEVEVVLEDKVKIEEETEVVEETPVEEKTEEEVETKKEVPVAETVKSYQVASRNNNNNKRSKNNKK